MRLAWLYYLTALLPDRRSLRWRGPTTPPWTM